MSLISVNLLPSEFILEQVKKQKFYKVQYLGISVLLLTFFLASLTISLRVLQSQKSNQIQKRLSDVQQKISTTATKEDQLIALKDRVTTISQYVGKPSKDSELYSFIEQNLSSEVEINTMSIDRSGDILLSVGISDIGIIDRLISTLSDKQPSGVRVKQISVENLGRSRDNSFRLSLRLKTS